MCEVARRMLRAAEFAGAAKSRRRKGPGAHSFADFSWASKKSRWLPGHPGTGVGVSQKSATKEILAGTGGGAPAFGGGAGDKNVSARGLQGAEPLLCPRTHNHRRRSAKQTHYRAPR
jgi:hypothetical protein